MKKAFSYVRFSRLHQQDGDSLRRQTAATDAYCRAHKLVLDESLSLKDLGVSAFKGKNVQKGALSRFIAACESGLVPKGSALIMESMDRLSRQSPRKTVRLLTELLDDHGIEVHLTMAGKIFLPESEDGVDLIFAVALAMRAHEESETKSRRLSEAFADKRKRVLEGEKVLMTKSLPWWLELDPKGQIVCPPDRKKIVRRIFDRTAKGESSNKIAWDLNAEKIKTFTKCSHWIDSRVRGLVNSEAPLGTLTETPKTKKMGRTWTIPGYYPRIISDEKAALARKTLMGNRRHGRPAKEAAPVNLLKGLARFRGVWVRFTHRENGIGWNGYYDSLHEDRPGCAWNASANQVEGVLIAALAELTAGDIEPTSEARDRVGALKLKLAALETKIENIAEAVEKGSTTMIARLMELEADHARTQTDLKEAQLEQPTRVDTSALRELAAFDHKDLKIRKKRPAIAAALRRIVARIDIGSTYEDVLEDSHDAVPEDYNPEDYSGFTLNEKIIADPTGSRGKKPLCIAVKFHGGADRMIMRGFPECAGGILTIRIAKD